MSELAKRDFARILIIKPSSPGDIIHALPVLHGLRRRFPGAHIAWLVATPFVDLVEADPALTEVISFDRKRFGRLGRSVRVSTEFAGFVRDLRTKQFDLVIDLQGLFRSGFLAMACGADVRIGFARARELSWMFYNAKIPASSNRDAHAADRNYGVAALLGFADLPMDFSVSIREDDRRTTAALLRDVGIMPGGKYAVLVPATRWETKCWAAERYGQLARLLFERYGLRAILVGGATDVEAGQVAVTASGGSAANLCGRTSLRQLAALVEQAAVVVTADSTPMHLAAAMDRPLVALFGPTNPKRTGPYGRLDDVVRLELACSPCYYRRLSQCPHQHACMRDLTVERVAVAIKERMCDSRGGKSIDDPIG